MIVALSHFNMRTDMVDLIDECMEDKDLFKKWPIDEGCLEKITNDSVDNAKLSQPKVCHVNYKLIILYMLLKKIHQRVFFNNLTLDYFSFNINLFYSFY